MVEAPLGGSAMSRPLSVRKPTARELGRVHRWLEGPLKPWQRRRAEVLLLPAAGRSAVAMAQLLRVHVNPVSPAPRDFDQPALSSPRRPRRVGAPPRLSAGQIETIWHLANQPPTALGLSFSRWT